MRHLLVFGSRLVGLFRKHRLDRELAEEIESNLQMHIDDNLRAGMSAGEARRQALIKLGGVEATKEAYRDQWSLPVLDTILQEIRSTTRRIQRRSWGFTHLVLMLAVGFGCVTGMFDVAYGVLHVPLPFPNLDRVAVAENSGLLFAYQRPNPHIQTVFEKAALYELLDGNLDSPQEPKRLQVAMVSPEFFSTLGVRISLGHDFAATDYHPDPPSQPRWMPVILSHDLWRTYFGSNKAILNQSIELTITPYRYEVIGVAPPDVSFPSGVDAWVPLHLTSYSTIQTAGIPFGAGGVIGLLKPRLSAAGAETVIRTWPNERLFGSGRDLVVKLRSLRDFHAGEIYPLGLKLWLASIFFFVLITIAAATIFQTEAEARRDEFALRSALGASPGRLLGTLSLETGLAALLALGASFLVRWILIQFTASLLPLPKGFDSSVHGIDLAMAAAAVGIAFVASLFTQGASLWRFLPSFSIAALLPKESVKTHDKPGGVFRFRLPIQIIPAAMILIAAGLLVRTAYKTMHIDPGVQAGGVFVSEVSFSVDLGKFVLSGIDPRMSQEERDRAWTAGLRRFRELMNLEISGIVNTLEKSPRVIHTGVISRAPYKGHGASGMGGVRYSATLPVAPSADTFPSFVSLRSITPGAISALGMQLLYGRTFSGHGAEDEDMILVNEALAAKLGGGPSALGHYVELTSFPAARIIGVVSNVREKDLFSPAAPTAYFPFSQYGLTDVDLVVRAEPGVSSREALQLIEASVRATSPRAVLSHFRRLDEMVASAGTLARYTAYYLLALAVLSVLLSGFCASAKTLGEFLRRKREMGIRMALGATRRDIIGLFVYSDLARNTVAALLGALLAWWFAHLLKSLLYGVELFDPISYGFGVTVLIGSLTLVQIVLLRRVLQRNPRDLM